MRIKSPLSNLSETINQVKQSAALYQTKLQRNEAATRAVLIDPVLHALGWNIANTYMVEVEKVLDQSRVDYALYDRNGNVSLIIEAKPLGTNLNDSTITMTMVKYAYNFGAKQIFLTDGLIWLYVTIGEPGDIDFAAKNFAEDSPVDCAAYLVERLDAAKFWPEQETIDELSQRIGQIESDLITLQKEITQLKGGQAFDDSGAGNPTTASSDLTPPAPHFPQNAPKEAVFVDLASASNLAHTSPALLRLPDGSILAVRRWQNVLVECCKLALNSNEQVPIPLPDKAGKIRRLINWTPPPPGQTYVEEQYKGQTVYINTNYSANECVANAVHVLRYVPEFAKKVNPGLVFNKA